jgi:hypothetical protein
MKKTMFGMMVGAAIAGLSPSAQATARITLNDGVHPAVVINDNISPDTGTATGIMQSSTTLGVWTVIVSTETKPAFGTATMPMMDVSVQAFSSAAGTLSVSFSDNNFGPKKGTVVTGLLTAIETGSVVYGSGSIDFKVWGDSGNVLGAQTSLLADAGAQDWPPAINPFPGSALLTAPFSLTEVLVLNVPGAAHLNVDASFQVFPDVPKGVAGCRVTGGSNKETNNWQSACVPTTPPSFISHGGQVGAALSDETPFTPADPCIMGEWQHNRHLTANGLVGVLHASGNGNVHEYDSLLCACLPCPGTTGTGSVGNICNPNNKPCGPLPRKAPANKICFSGVGDFTYASGPKTVKAVFRVDIEDRSEGNSQASAAPADRYRIRIWLLDPNCGRDPNPDSAVNMSLRFGASADPNQIVVLSTTENLKDPSIAPPDIDDGGDMVQGNHQIHPATGAKCN